MREKIDSIIHQREYLAMIGFENKEAWYNISWKQIQQNGGISLLNRYKGSPTALITSVYSDHTWNLHQFQSAPKYYWQSEKNCREFLDWLGNSSTSMIWTIGIISV
jgi:hypothetical protein